MRQTVERVCALLAHHGLRGDVTYREDGSALVEVHQGFRGEPSRVVAFVDVTPGGNITGMADRDPKSPARVRGRPRSRLLRDCIVDELEHWT